MSVKSTAGSKGKMHCAEVSEIVGGEWGEGRTLLVRGEWSNELAELLESEKIVNVRLSRGAGWKDKSIEFVSELRHITGLEIYAWDVKDVSAVFSLPQLTTLALQSEFTSPAPFEQLQGLRQCFVSWRKSISGLLSMPLIERLQIDRYPHEDFLELSELQSLRRLKISSPKLNSFSGLQRLALLHTIEASLCPRLQDISELQTLANLQTLKLVGCKGLGTLPHQMPANLEQFYLDDCGDVASIGGLARCPLLSDFSAVGNTNIADGQFAFLAGLTHLRKVAYGNRKHYTPQLDELRNILKSNEVT